MPLFSGSGGRYAAGTALLAALALLYGPVLVRLAQVWQADPNYSHGYLILPLALYLAYERREALTRLEIRPATVAGLIVVGFSLFLLALGTLASEFFVTRISFIVALVGCVLFLFGAAHVRTLAFPLACLLLMVPLPALVFNQIAFPLQLLASRLGESLMSVAGVPVLREGNVIILASTTLEVAEACSGIRSLISLLTLGIVFGYFTDARTSVRVVLAVATIPVAILANAFRVAGTGIAAHYWSPAAADGFFHSFSGWIVFGAAVVMLVLIAKVLTFALPRPTPAVAPQFS